MMGEQRFEFYSDDYLIGVLDNVTGKTLNHFATIDLLNEQQATITELESDKAIAEDYANIFEKENVKLRKKLNEQQDIIFKLQDLCGKSDYENAQLRQKVKELQDKIDMLCEKYDYPNEKDKTKSGEK